MSLTFFVAALFIVLALFSSSLLSYFETQPQITAFFKDSKTQKNIGELQTRLQKDPQIESLKYVSKEEALRIYKQDHQDEPLLLEMVTKEILPASLEIKAKNIEYLNEIAARMEKEAGVEDVIYQKDVVDKLLSWTRSIRAAGGLFLIVLAIETLLIVLIIIGMQIVGRRREITILQLIGASSWYISMPFLLQGSIYGILGGVLGWAASFGMLAYQAPFFESLLKGVGRLSLSFAPQFTIWPFSTELMLLILASTALSGCLLGIFGSFIAVHRYLK